ncbi:hypothetical protein L2E82_08340 [Cichorium intybus]|uniref:Uncharacterized protein n=1 Tax=Cichorium intybus TaxID=13427 RepID=A0ACB9G6B3_CICIN|nr:hypothetical protein L2E82_08340 [Cichorium intybus]
MPVIDARAKLSDLSEMNFLLYPDDDDSVGPIKRSRRRSNLNQAVCLGFHYSRQLRSEMVQAVVTVEQEQAGANGEARCIKDSLVLQVGLRIVIYKLSSSYFIKSTFTSVF